MSTILEPAPEICVACANDPVNMYREETGVPWCDIGLQPCTRCMNHNIACQSLPDELKEQFQQLLAVSGQYEALKSRFSQAAAAAANNDAPQTVATPFTDIVPTPMLYSGPSDSVPAELLGHDDDWSIHQRILEAAAEDLKEIDPDAMDIDIFQNNPWDTDHGVENESTYPPDIIDDLVINFVADYRRNFTGEPIDTAVATATNGIASEINNPLEDTPHPANPDVSPPPRLDVTNEAHRQELRRCIKTRNETGWHPNHAALINEHRENLVAIWAREARSGKREEHRRRLGNALSPLNPGIAGDAALPFHTWVQGLEGPYEDMEQYHRVMLELWCYDQGDGDDVESTDEGEASMSDEVESEDTLYDASTPSVHSDTASERYRHYGAATDANFFKLRDWILKSINKLYSDGGHPNHNALAARVRQAYRNIRALEAAADEPDPYREFFVASFNPNTAEVAHFAAYPFSFLTRHIPGDRSDMWEFYMDILGLYCFVDGENGLTDVVARDVPAEREQSVRDDGRGEDDGAATNTIERWLAGL